ncbi:hypothetical protein Nocox_30145 [Nonomuraea coxensis DSM 45129]|uniref:DUF1707 domain-containing protein n=1 Tax=Nonomuraea coxensis DSM 45129 TaxID=1122611 RepID=A0ABX8U7E2_9ACTN|nr:DUF1707 domain-containing protein [Nonomuraea coxensis]QYC43613.1 hypothetical protein Nocox_30145 [Nonomuraea coxensis DSM 45129]
MDPNDLRVGDAEREQTMAALREHFAEGRLTREELDERLDHALAAKTVRDLAQVTADLPGSQPGPRRAPEHRVANPWVPPPLPGMGDWHEAMRAHRHQMHQVHHEMRRARKEMRHQWKHGPARHHRHRGPHPFVGLLFLFVIIGFVVGGFGVLKVLFGVWLVAMVFSLVRRRVHHRG